MILGVSVDVLSLSRFQALIARRGHARIAHRILSSTERDAFANVSPDAQLNFLASRWAVKEAAYKACYPAYRLTWKEVTLVKRDGKPTVQHALEGVQLHASLSHDADCIVAMVVAEVLQTSKRSYTM